MNAAAKSIFEEQVLASLATINDDGSPRSTPLHVVTDGRAVYWFSPADKVHSHNLQRDARASVSLFSPDESEGLKGVYISGRAAPVPVQDRERVITLYTERVGHFPPPFVAWTAYALPVGTLDEQKSTGNCWYFYS